ACTKTCPMSLPVEKLASGGVVLHSECIQCGACCDACKQDALHLVFGVVQNGRARQRAPRPEPISVPSDQKSVG
ncbi:MAG: 4Fe-4S dicluster domain-containing protein, partial [Coriobacteriales bacterium]